MRVLVVTPTYNERASLPKTLTRLLSANPHVHALVVDDASPDGTGELAQAIADDDERVHVLHRPGKQGLGSAYRAGFRWALERDYDVLVEMDADGSHAPEQLSRLLAPFADGSSAGWADVVLGARWVPGGAVHNWPLRRVLLSRGGTTYARLALKLPLHDATGGYRAYRREVFDHLDLRTVTSQGYSFQVEMAWRALQAGLRVVEVPIDFTERDEGVSKMSPAIVREALRQVAVWGVQTWTGRQPRL